MRIRLPLAATRARASELQILSFYTTRPPANRTYLYRIHVGIANNVAKNGYRADLRQAAVARASAIRKSQKPVKESPEKKLRGSKAKKAAAEKET
jgi:large subunit ribosomal protein L28e